MREHTRAHRLLTASMVPAVISGAAFHIKNPQTGKCMTVAGGRSTENNVEPVQFDCDQDRSRTWNLNPVGRR